jgi:hypothetical protein
MVQAAAHGVVDFSTADLLDRQWWMKLWWMLDQVEADNLVLVRQMEHAHNISLLDYYLEQKIFDLHWDRAVQALRDTWDTLFPWCKMGGDATASAKDKLTAAWIKQWGDPNDPETLRKIKLTVDYLKSMRERAHKRQNKLPRRTILQTRRKQG